VQQPAA
jgi:protein transport protein SEC24